MKLSIALYIAFFLTACGGTNTNTNNNSNSNAKIAASPAAQNLTIVERPQKIKDLIAARGKQDEAKPLLKIISPMAGSVINSSTVDVAVEISGDLKGYRPMKEMDGTGNHVHVILDNQPYEAYYNIDQKFELRNVADGEHTLRVFPSRPWHESYKNEGAFQIIKFTVKNGGGDTTKPTTTNAGNTMANASNANAVKKSTPEGKDMQNSIAGAVDLNKPLLTYSRPKGEYKDGDADAIMIDFWLENAKLKDDGGEYRVRLSVDEGVPKFIDKWEPIWLSGWTTEKHTIKLELVDKDGNVVDNGGYNSTTREITIQ